MLSRSSAAALLAALVFATATGHGQVSSANADRDMLMRDVRTLSSPTYEGRAAGTRGGLRARQYIVDQFRVIGIAPAGTAAYLQWLTGGAANVLGRIDGTENLPAIVISAHYDHDGIRNGVLYPGADDNASGVAAMLAIARYFRLAPGRHPLILAAFDAEEDGMRGSKAFVSAGIVPRDGIALNINLDMVSRSASREIYAAGTAHYPALRPILEGIQTGPALRLRFGHDVPVPGGSRRDDWTTLSDHASFHAAGVPFIYFGVEDHPDYHQPTDTPDKIDPRFFGNVADLVIEAVLAFDAALDR
jgi:Zn-dependent M28 family amino/carboxypeptidase